MPSLAEIRQQYPQYSDLNDTQLANALHQAFYKDVPVDQFNAAIGYKTAKERNPAEYDPSSPAYQEKYGLTSIERNMLGIPRALGLTARMPIDAASAIPLAAADFGIGVRNIATGGGKNLIYAQPGDTQSASSLYGDAMTNLGFPSPNTPLEKVGQFVGTAIAGSKLPAPEISNPAPIGFVRPQTPRNTVLAAAQNEGYAVPPATANPNALTKTLEGAAGKLSTAQQASANNAEVTNALARQATGLAEDAPITPEALQLIRSQAAQSGYEPIRGIGTIRGDSQYSKDLADIAKQYAGPSKSFPGLDNAQVQDIVGKMNQKSFDAGDAIDATKFLRDSASDAFAKGDSQVGRAYRSISKALEDAIERALSRRGQNGADMLSNFRDARQAIAKTHSVEDALNSATGDVSAVKLGQQLAKGVPLSSELKTIGQFAQAFPKAARSMNESLPGISPLDFYGAGGVAGMTKQPWYLLYPFARQAIRAGLLSPTGQRLLASPPTGPTQIPPELVMGGTTGLLSQ